jgi:hypothetical protein
MSFSEARLEHTFARLLEQEGYRHCLGNTLQRGPEEVQASVCSKFGF